MREPARDKGRVEDILEAADYIKQFTDGKIVEQIRVFIYYEDKFIVDILKYIETFSDE